MPQTITASPATDTPTPIPAWAATGRPPPSELSLDVLPSAVKLAVEDADDAVADEDDDAMVDDKVEELLGRGSSVMLK